MSVSILQIAGIAITLALIIGVSLYSGEKVSGGADFAAGGGGGGSLLVCGGIMGALAASGVAGTFFQYTKMIPIGAASASCAMISQTVGRGERGKLPGMVHSFQVIYLLVGLLTCCILLLLRTPVLSFYKLTQTAHDYTVTQMTIQAVISIGMSFQMPEQTGIIRGGGDTRYSMISDIIYSWGVVVPLSMIAAFVLHAPFWVVVWCLNIDQLIKCITVTQKVHSWTWVKTLT